MKVFSQNLIKNAKGESRMAKFLLSQNYRGLFGFNTKQEPIKFSTSKILPFSQENFFRVVKDVDDYQNFIPWISNCKVFPATIQENFEGGRKLGRFEAETKIGFSQLTFGYISHVSYEQPHWILSESLQSRIFEGLYSHWAIKALDTDACEITYNIQMTFSNPIYTAVTTHFFDFLSNNINKAFEQRCHELYYKNKEMNEKMIAKTSQNFSPESQTQINHNHEIALLIKHKQFVVPEIPQIKKIEELKKSKDHLKLPEDYWVWDLNDKNIVNRVSRDQTQSLKFKSVEQILQKKTWRSIILESIQDLQKSGLLIEIDLNKVRRTLEASENALRELRDLYEAFGKDQDSKEVYARHMNKTLISMLQKQQQ